MDPKEVIKGLISLIIGGLFWHMMAYLMIQFALGR